MNIFKRSFNVFLVLFLILSLCALGSSDSDAQKKNTDQKEQKSSKKEDIKEFKVGETWTVPDQWSVTVNNVTETNERNEYLDEKPAAVYIVDYTYTNLGYIDSFGSTAGMFIYLDDQIVDSEGTSGYKYSGKIAYYPQQTPIGATCKAQAMIGVEHPGTFKVTCSKYNSDQKLQEAVFIMDPSAEAVESNEKNYQLDSSSALKIGETWTVPDQWELTIKGVKEVEERNKGAVSEPGAVYIIDYEYKNLGYVDKESREGLLINIDKSIVDSNGIMGYSYPGSVANRPKETPVGAVCKAQACVAVEHPGDFIMNVFRYDDDLKEHSQAYYIDVD